MAIISNNSPKRKFVDPNRIPKTEAKNTGFDLKFTDEKLYDLDKIINDIRRDNSDADLIVKVNTEEGIISLVADYINNQLKQIYGVSNVTYIPAYQIIFDSYFKRYYPEVSEQLRKSNLEGSLTSDVKQGPVSISKSDTDRYVLDYEQRTAYKPSQSIFNLKFTNAGNSLSDDTSGFYDGLYETKPTTGVVITEPTPDTSSDNVEFTDLPEE
jgi:hypothetical protein